MSWPDDATRWLALALAPVVAAALLRLLSSERGCRWTLRLAPICAALLSAAYVVVYLRGGPRIIDATSYWLEARALSRGMLAWPIDEPEQAVLGRFLLRTTWNGEPAVGVIFPPGYPAVLAIGFALGAPLAIGPIIGASLVVATAHLARLVARSTPSLAASELPIAALAAVLSVACAALRYHTADTMSHGFAALCFTVALASTWSLLASPTSRALPALAAGLSLGWLFATRPASALACAATLSVAWLSGWLPRRPRLREIALALVAALPPLALWIAHQSVVAGELFGSTQLAYYAASDGPPGCFRYGFGRGIGCLGEHGDFVRHNLSDGYGPFEVLAVCARRLKMHLSDPLNAAPLALLPLAAVFVRAPLTKLLLAALPLQLAAYAPFYFDGNYPGGGARMLADVLPLEHALAAAALGTFASQPSYAFNRISAAVVALTLAGFAFSTGADHAQLRDREGGRPMFEAERAPPGALVFVDTDHGFNLGYRPDARVLVRHRGDALDRLAWEARGRPPAFRYRYLWDDTAPARVSLEPLAFDPAPSDSLSLRVEGESLWPPSSQLGGFVWPSYAVPACASTARALLVTSASPEAPATIRARLPSALAGRPLVPVVVPSRAGSGELRVLSEGFELARWSIPPSAAPGCVALDARPIPAATGDLELVLSGPSGLALDALDLQPIE